MNHITNDNALALSIPVHNEQLRRQHGPSNGFNLGYANAPKAQKAIGEVDARQPGCSQAKRFFLPLIYRGTWCPFCNLTVQANQEQFQLFQDRGVALVAISPQTPDHSLTLQEKHHLKFPVSSDSGNGVARQFGIVIQMDRALKEVQELFGVEVAAYDGDGRYELPVPAAFLVSKTGEIIRSYVEVKYMKRLAPETALKWIDETKCCPTSLRGLCGVD